MSTRTLAVVMTIAGGLLPLHGCAIDFDAPFAQAGWAGSPLAEGGTDASTGGSGGGAGAAGFGGTGGSDTGGSGGTSTGGTGGTSTGGTGGGVSSETCDNMEDDDDDGLADCADPDCNAMGYACLPSPPSPWIGPVQFNVGDVPNCVGSWPNAGAEGGVGFIAPAGSTCPSCSCATSADAKCGMDVVVFADPGCTGTSQSTTFSSDGQCINVGMQALGPESVRPTSGMRVVSGSCSPQTTGSPSFPPAGWQDEAGTCLPSTLGAGCDPSQYCSPPAEDGLICVTRPGTHVTECPVDYGGVSWVLYRDVDDNRSCSPCTCGAPSGDCSGAEISVEDPSGGCPGTGTVLANGVCTALPIHSSMGTFSIESWLPGGLQANCSPSGGSATGTVQPASPLTVCCRTP
jgi:hypothetical protein